VRSRRRSRSKPSKKHVRAKTQNDTQPPPPTATNKTRTRTMRTTRTPTIPSVPTATNNVSRVQLPVNEKTLKNKRKTKSKKPKKNTTGPTASSLVAERKRKKAAGKIGAVIRGWQSRHVNSLSVRMNQQHSEISLRGVNPAWVKSDASEWWSGLIQLNVGYSLARSSYSDTLWLVSVFVDHNQQRIMFLGHNTTATGNQELELRMVIYGKRAAALILYAYSKAENHFQQVQAQQNSTTTLNNRNDVLLHHAYAGEFLAGCLHLVSTRRVALKKSRRHSIAKKRSTTPAVHLVIKTDIHISLMQARYKVKLHMRKEEKQMEIYESQAATLLQKFARGRATRDQVNNELVAHKNKRRKAASMLVKNRRLYKKKRQEKLAATVLQARYRGRKTRLNLTDVKHGMMSQKANENTLKSGEAKRLKESGLRDHEISVAIRLNSMHD
jgi:hypothetical protein